MPKGAELFLGTAIPLGIDSVFKLVGDHLNEVLAEAARAGIDVLDLRHESAVTHAADAWARILGGRSPDVGRARRSGR
jgi:acetolactate synthase-1/2/3 large subunit